MAKAKKASPKKNPVGRPKRTDKNNETAPPAERHTLPGEMRKTYIMKKDHVARIEKIATEDDKSQKETLAEALDLYFKARDGHSKSNKDRDTAGRIPKQK